jgi:amidase/aspartyl-tRNA(Asn)/glutamyl-tRNA(Gln) amidotransferase subunit A
VGKAVRAFEQAGAHVEEVKVGIKRPQKQLSDLWCRLIMPLNLQTLDSFRDAGVDVLKDHRNDLPPEYLFWVEQDVGARFLSRSGGTLRDL